MSRLLAARLGLGGQPEPVRCTHAHHTVVATAATRPARPAQGHSAGGVVRLLRGGEGTEARGTRVTMRCKGAPAALCSALLLLLLRYLCSLSACVVGGVTMYACTGHSIQPSRGSRIEGSVWGNVCVGVCGVLPPGW
jgi:hypothetical protein